MLPVLVVLLVLKDPREVPATPDSPDLMVNPGSRDPKERTVKMVRTENQERLDHRVKQDLPAKWDFQDRLANLDLKDQLEFREALDSPVTRVTKGPPVYQVHQEHRVIKEYPDLKVLQDYEVPLVPR